MEDNAGGGGGEGMASGGSWRVVKTVAGVYEAGLFGGYSDQVCKMRSVMSPCWAPDSALRRI